MSIDIRETRIRKLVENQIAEKHNDAADTHDRLLKLFVLTPSVAVILGIGAANGIYAGSLGSTTGESLAFGGFTFLVSTAVAGIPLGFSVSDLRVARYAWTGLTTGVAALCIASSFGIIGDTASVAHSVASTAPAQQMPHMEADTDADDAPDEPYAHYVDNLSRWYAAADEKRASISRQTHNCRVIRNELEEQICGNFYRLAKQLAAARAAQDKAKAQRIDAVERIEVVRDVQVEPSFAHKAFGALIKVSALLLACLGLAYYTEAKHGLSSGQHGKKPVPQIVPPLDLEPDREAMARADFDAWADACLTFDPSSTVETRPAFISYEGHVRGKGGKPMPSTQFADELARHVYAMGGTRSATARNAFDGAALVGGSGSMGGNSQAFGSSDFGFGGGY